MEPFEDVLEFWFGAPGADPDAQRDIWFSGGPAVDAEIIERFGAVYEKAAAGQLDHWRDDARSCLALILVLDQFPRNMFRGDARSFATDAKAVAAARHALDKGYDRDSGAGRQFYYMPFEHSEDLDDQRRSVDLFNALPDGANKQENVEYAASHMEIIERFGRFPHRNAILGRESTPEEIAFLTEGGEEVRFGTDPNAAEAESQSD